MRGLKFRAWDLTYDPPRMFGWELLKEFNPAELFNQEDCIVMQFTGLCDKNGKEIYSGDILTSDDYPFTSEDNKNYVGVVEWAEEEGYWFVDVVRISDRVCGRACGGMLSEYENMEVIGNIYENPELVTL